MRRFAAATLAGAALLGGLLSGVGMAASGSRVLTLRLRTVDLVLRVAQYGETQDTSPARVSITLAADVLFRFGSAELTNKAQQILRGVVVEIREQARGPVYVDGYTDSKGSSAYNRGLSNRRAKAVQEALTSSGATFVVRGYGAADAVAPNTLPDGADNPAGRAKNRRVTVSFAKR